MMAAPLPGDNLTCDFNVISSLVYKDGKIIQHTTEEANPIRFTGLTSKQPSMTGNLGSNPLIQIINDTEKTVLMEVGENVYGLITYTIFRTSGVGVWTKAYSILGHHPFGLVAMGQCR